jgi:hypothetical protein
VAEKENKILPLQLVSTNSHYKYASCIWRAVEFSEASEGTFRFVFLVKYLLYLEGAEEARGWDGLHAFEP